jgi:hypothetical protein
MSLSQYKRYLRGDTSIPNNKLLQIADRLKFTISEIHKLYQDRSNTQLRRIDQIYTMTRSKHYEDAYRLALELREDIFISEYNQLYFDFCFVHLQNKLNMVSDVHVLELYSELINYPECLQNESFNWVEMNILFQMILTSSKMENYELADFMYKILTDNNHVFSVSKDLSLLPNIYLVLGQTYGRQRNYKRVLDVVNSGIAHCLKHQTSFALASLFLVKAFAHWDLDEKEQAIEAGRRSIMQLYVENNTSKISEYKQRLSKGLDLDFNEYCEL